MKTKIALITMLGSVLLLSGCSDMCGGCGGCGFGGGYYSYNSTCGYPSCTDNSCIAANTTGNCCDRS